MIDSKIGRYDIIKLLGQGSMAIVYEAYDPAIDRTLAIKMLREERCIEPENRNRFLQEAKAAGNLSHPHIVTIHDVGEVKNRPYIVMELLEGSTLDDMLESGQHFGIGDTIDICTQLANALHYAHECGVVHRDIKPSNIVCTNATTSEYKVKITDFGIAHVTDSNLTQGTETGALLGTPYYISPEQVLGNPVDGRADLFSLGITMYHLFSGQRPFIGSNMHTLLFQIATEDHRPITQIKPDFPLQLKRVIDKCLEKDPADRYQSGQELVADLQLAADDIAKRGAKSSKPRALPISVKQSLSISLLLITTLTITALVVTQFYQRSLQRNIEQLGTGVAKFIASQNTVAVLRQDWLAVELFIQHMGDAKQIHRIRITDFEGVIRGDSLQRDIGKTIKINMKDSTARKIDNILIYAHPANDPIVYWGIPLPELLGRMLNLQNYFEFYAGMSFDDRHVGNVIVSFSPDVTGKPRLDALLMILSIGLACIVAAFLFTFYVTRSRTKSLLMLRTSMNDIASGNYTQRIKSSRKDDIGETFITYNHMADKLQERDLRRQPDSF